jgi:hypothetical protein
MIAKLGKLWSWIRSVISERDGTGSSSRIGALTIIGSGCFSLIVVSVKTLRLPGGQELAGLAAVFSSAAGLYGFNCWKNRNSDPGSNQDGKDVKTP